MSVLERLSKSLGRSDEAPNLELAQNIVRNNRRYEVKELIDNLANKNKNIQSDCIKVLYEVGNLKPELIAEYHKEFGALLDSKNNRLVWGGMTALDMITLVNPKGVHGQFPKILASTMTGSVITRDHAVGVLAKLSSLEEFADECYPLLLDQLRKCPDNQFPMYAEMSLLAAGDDVKKRQLAKLVTTRLRTLEKESQRKRVKKTLKTLTPSV